MPALTFGALAAPAAVEAQPAPQGAQRSPAPAASAPAAGAPKADQIARAKTLFDLGAKAYESENFPAAIQAFQEAYKLSQRPGPVFSIAQAYRRIHATDRKPETLKLAISHYKLYIEKQKVGGRIAEAEQALRDLESSLPAAPPGGGDAPPVTAPAPPVEVKPKTRLMVSSPTKGAMASLDGGEPAELPLFQELAAGDHSLRLMAEGYFDDERPIVAAEGGVVGLDIALREKPALLTIRTEPGATVSIDGRNEGTTPLPRSISVSSGTHLVTLSKLGYKPYSAEIDFRRDEKRPLEVSLSRTTQREAAFGVLGVATAGTLAGVILSGLTLLEQNRALHIEELKGQRNLTAAELAEHQEASARRDDLRMASATAFGGALLVAAIGTGLFVFDRPTPGLPIRIRDETPKAPEARRPHKPTAFVLPWAGPTGGGATVHFIF